MINFGVFGHIYKQFDKFIDIFNTNTVNSIIVINVIPYSQKISRIEIFKVEQILKNFVIKFLRFSNME